MTVRQAVVKADEDAQERAAQPSVAAVVRQAIEAQSSAFRTVLPRHVDPERFSRLTLAAVKASPELMRCFETPQGQTSVLIAAMQAAAVGLEPNTPTQDAWILPRRNQNVWEAQLMIGYRGLLKLARRSGTIETIYAEVVHEGDEFTWSRGLDRDVLEHQPGLMADGELTHAYAVARYKAGGYSFMVLNRAQVEARRALSESWRSQKGRQYSPWARWPEQMWRKTAIRSLIPFLDLEPESERLVHMDEKPLHFDDEAGVVEVASAFAELTPGQDDAEPPVPVDADGAIETEEPPGYEKAVS